MEALQTCGGCGGFVGDSAAACPHCAAKPSRRRRWAVALGLAGSATLGLTMMACYGAPPCVRYPEGCRTPQDASKDARPDAGVDR